MSIEIYTYQDPYRLDKEDFWDEINDCPYFCVSQTLVNGLKSVYGNNFTSARVTTVDKYIKQLFSKWQSPSTVIRQHAAIDNVLNYEFKSSFDEKHHANLTQAFKYNRDDVFKSIRTMFELNINPNNIRKDKLSNEQLFIVELYNTILESRYSKDFSIESVFDNKEISIAMLETLQDAYKDQDTKNLVKLNLDRVVIHGIHQFSPIVLRMIDEIAKYKKVIILFNYQLKFEKVYKTWIDIYELFDKKIIISEKNEVGLVPATRSYEGNVLANNLGKIADGKLNEINTNIGYKPVIVFNNMTEFAGYIARKFDCAIVEAGKLGRNPLSQMHEQFYSADSSVNDILKMYFPEQFGERQFLNYPLGHFFLGVANMWDTENSELPIQNISDIKECFSAGIIKEKNKGDLLNILGKCESLFIGCENVDSMVSRINKNIKSRKYMYDNKEFSEHISYYNCTQIEMEELKAGLVELKELAEYFYKDFAKTDNNFGEFYKKLRNFIENKLESELELNNEFSDIIKRVLLRLDEVKDIRAKASFDCLKSTMKIYLQQETDSRKSANWIVRNFEQLDGDILRTKNRRNITYHFGCLTDEDVNMSLKREFPWPLDSDFFEIAQEPTDWKYLVYVKSAQEYRNFKRYALIVGLQFNYGKYTLSYVKKNDNRDRELYTLLKLLGLKEENYLTFRQNEKLEEISDLEISTQENIQVSKIDFYKYNICPHKFLLESIFEGNTIYKDDFLIKKYMEIVLENSAKIKYENMSIIPVNIISDLEEVYDETVKKLFPMEQNINRTDVINNVKNRLLKAKCFPKLNQKEKEYMKIREYFIYKQIDNHGITSDLKNRIFKDVDEETILKTVLSDEAKEKGFVSVKSGWCEYCPNKDNCLANY